jgi:glutamine amidotransferase
MIAIVDYGLGNIESVKYALDRLGAGSVVTAKRGEIAAADGVILPGVGAFGQAMANLRALGLVEALREAASSPRPFLGICLGLQLLFDSSEEHGRHEGLAILPGGVRRFPAEIRVPQMGWNQVRQVRPGGLFAGIEDGAWFYFAHSYYAVPADADAVIGATDYGGEYASAVQRGPVLAVQFHPEKSGPTGLRMLQNFCSMCGKTT